MSFQDFLVGRARILDAVIAVMDQPSRRLATLNGHEQRPFTEFGAQMIVHGPAHDLTRPPYP